MPLNANIQKEGPWKEMLKITIKVAFNIEDRTV